MRRSWPRTTPHFGNFVSAKPAAMPCVATGKLRKPSTANDWSLPERPEPPVAVGSRALTRQAPSHHVNHPSALIPSKALSALLSSQSGAAAAEYGSRHRLLRASARSTASPWQSGRLQRSAGSARRVSGSSRAAGLPAVRPNPSLKLTRYGMRCKPGPRHMVHHRSPGLQRTPPRAA
jgi:hypothetical protein